MSITEETQSVDMTGIVTELKKIQERLQALENRTPARASFFTPNEDDEGHQTGHTLGQSRRFGSQGSGGPTMYIQSPLCQWTGGSWI